MEIKKEDYLKVTEKILGSCGRMISSSKGQYSWDNKNNIAVFNSNICIKEIGKIWYGDVDITLESDKLQKLAKVLKTSVYVLYESDARFEREDDPNYENAVFIFTPTETIPGEKHKDAIKVSNKKYTWKPTKSSKKSSLLKYDEQNDYKEEDFVELQILTPKKKVSTIKMFESEKKEVSPLEKFGEYVVANVKDEKKLLSITDIYVANDTYKDLEDIMCKWFTKQHGFKKGSYQLQKNMSWLTFSMPCNFYGSEKGPKWAKKNIIYIKKSFFNK